MARKRNLTAQMPYEHMNAPSGPGDPLAGCHFENYLAQQFQYKMADVETPMGETLAGPDLAQEDRDRYSRMTEWYGPGEAKRRMWADSTEPGGHTFCFPKK